MKFIATRYEMEGEFSEVFEADSEAHAEVICIANGWLLDGELVHTGCFNSDCPFPSLEVH